MSPSANGKQIAEVTFQHMREECAMHPHSQIPPGDFIWAYGSQTPVAYQHKHDGLIVKADAFTQSYENAVALANLQLMQQIQATAFGPTPLAPAYFVTPGDVPTGSVLGELQKIIPALGTAFTSCPGTPCPRGTVPRAVSYYCPSER